MRALAKRIASFFVSGKPKHYKKPLLAGAAVVLSLAAAGILLVWKPWGPEPAAGTASGEAEAVMTTKIRVCDGIWDAKRYSDELYCPIGLAFEGGNLIVADSMCDRVQIIGAEKTRRVGKPGQYGLSYLTSGALVDGYLEDARFQKPSDVAVRAGGETIICDTGNHVIRKMDGEFVTTIAGNGEAGYREGKEGEARFNAPRSVAVDGEGVIYVADTMNHCIRRVDTNGNVTLYAGGPTESGFRDGALTEARFYEPCGLYLSPEGELYVADSANHCIRKISNGAVTTIAGAPGEPDRNTGYPQGGYIDGGNESARFHFPRALAMLPDGSLAVADSMNHAVRKVTAWETRTLVGNGLADQYYASAENLKLTRPEGLCADGETLYISDSLNNRVVAVPLTGRILEGRPSRGQLLSDTGVSTDSTYAYKGDIRIYLDGQRVDMGRVQPWNTPECIYIPIRPLFEALGAAVALDEKTGAVTITLDGQDTVLRPDKDYFILKGVAVTTADEVMRLFPYTFEWFPEFSLIALRIPSDLKQNEREA